MHGIEQKGDSKATNTDSIRFQARNQSNKKRIKREIIVRRQSHCVCVHDDDQVASGLIYACPLDKWATAFLLLSLFSFSFAPFAFPVLSFQFSLMRFSISSSTDSWNCVDKWALSTHIIDWVAPINHQQKERAFWDMKFIRGMCSDWFFGLCKIQCLFMSTKKWEGIKKHTKYDGKKMRRENKKWKQ